MNVSSHQASEVLDAIELAVNLSKKVEGLNPFNPRISLIPNKVDIFVGEDENREYMRYFEFLPIAKELQTRLYGGGNFAYTESSGHFSILLSINVENIDISNKYIVKNEGAAMPVESLEELLDRIQKSKS